MIKIAIADDHRMFCAGLSAMLEEEENIQIVKTIPNGKLLLDYLKDHSVDIVLMDINMPEINGIEASKQILKYDRKTKIIILSMYKQPMIIRKLLALGVHAYILKETEKGNLLSAIEAVMEGKTYYDGMVRDVLLEDYSSDNQFHNCQLTPREEEIIKLISNGFTTQEIAGKLFISQYTVETHRKNLLAKTGAKNALGLLKYARENGLVL